MRKLIFSLLLAGVTVMTSAQTTRVVTGAVIDKYGNPIPEAKVEATGGAESTVTNADGTFSIEVSQWLKSLTASYPGMAKVVKNIKPNKEILFKMNKGIMMVQEKNEKKNRKQNKD